MRFSYNPLNSLAIGIALWLAALTLGPFLADSHYVTWVPLLVAVPAVLGALGALLRLPRLATLAVQTVALAGLVGWLGLRFSENVAAAAGLDPLERLGLLANLGAAAVRNGTLPLPSEPGLIWLVLVVLALSLLATELLVNGLEQPAWAIAPLVVIYGVGALMIAHREMNWLHFAAIAGGYLLILLTSTGFGGGRRAGRREHLVAFHAGRGAVAVAVALVAGLVALVITPLMPQGPKQPWLQSGANAPIQLSDPTVALNENLQRPEETEILRYTTSDGAPVYLRAVALTRLTTDGAQLVPMELATGGLGGASTQPGRRVETKVSIQYRSEYLPAPFVVDSFRADGRWAYDPDTLAIVATGDDRLAQTTDLDYSVTSDVPEPTRDDLLAAEAGVDPAGDETVKVPVGLSPAVADLTADVTVGAATAGAKALAIQDFLRSKPFRYDLTAPQSDSLDTISTFLLESRSGYCIHFAAAMVTMSRIEQIPARMAVGFTPGKKVGDEYVVTTHNMHAWPELYFEDLGWVPFEPTKSVANPPAWTNPDDEPTTTPSATPSPTATPSTPVSQPAEPTMRPTTRPQQPTEGDEGPNPGWFILAGALVLLVLPFTIRTAQRAWRLRGGQPPVATADAAWDEVAATFRDFGLDWDSHSPGVAVESLVHGLSPGAAATLTGIARTVERARFARDGADTSSLAADVRSLRKDLIKTQPGDRQARALVIPASLWPGGK